MTPRGHTQVLSDRTRQDGHALAASHVLGPSAMGRSEVRRRHRRLDRGFERVFEELQEAVPGTGTALPLRGREWLLDNSFVVSDTIEILRRALPARFLAGLPGLRAPEEDVGRPRVEVLARALVRGSGGRVELASIRDFLGGYQELRSLRLAELWALPSFLRLVLLEELLEGLSAPEASIEVGPYILFLRALSAADWRTEVEALSRVDRMLSADPAGVYLRMDFRSRDRYRGEVERVARRGRVEEEAVAKAVLELARARSGDEREGHVGYYLLDEGRAALFSALGVRLPLTGIPSTRRRVTGALYTAGVTLGVVAALLLVWQVTGGGATGVLLLAMALVPALGVAVSVTNWVAAHFVSPRPLPRLDLREGIPDRFRTVVAVPVLLSTEEDLASVLHSVEANFLANEDPHITFAILSDLPDAASERVEGDARLVRSAIHEVRRLNLRHGTEGRGGPFVLLYRSRRWNPSEGCWMGWERKRGKLTELNQLLLGDASGLQLLEGDRERLRGVPFVLTLDADTRLPRDAAARLIGVLAHPLQRPELDASGRVRRGYSVLQPRIEILPEPDGGTLFSRFHGGIQGLDLYARAAFDVYQDLFDVGIFAGKGIYDVRAFEASLAGRVPENALLSHDLFEGAHGRAGLVSDVILVEDFPGHPVAYAKREHRWIRGDWQILPWLFPRVPGPGGRRIRNPLPILQRWLILDNLRRSLQPVAILLLFLGGWALLPDAVGLWTACLAAVVGLPVALGTVDAVLRGLREIPRPADLEVEGRALGRALGRWALDLSLIPVTAWNAADAVARTLVRVFLTRRHLLEWRSAAHTARQVATGHALRSVARGMAPGPVTAVVATGGLLLAGGVPTGAIPVLLLWALAPALGVLVSRPRRPVREPRGVFPPERARVLARRVWGYYEHFQGPECHWLAPDHFQESPGAGEVAHRTSPTNVGMAMAAAATAWDLGFSTTPRFITRIANTVDGLARLTRYRGHFLNWYDTSTLEPLHPRYVSTVDSGNLAVSFLAVRETLKEARLRPLWTAERWRGLRDTAGVLVELLRERGDDAGAQPVLVRALALEGWMGRRLEPAWEGGLHSYIRTLHELRDQQLPTVEEQLIRVEEAPVEEELRSTAWRGIHAWMARLRREVEETVEEFALFLPWCADRYLDDPAARTTVERAFPPGGPAPTLVRLAELLEKDAPDDPALAVDLGYALDAVYLLLDDCDRLIAQLDTWYEEMDFSFLYDRRRYLFRIGFSVTTGMPDPNHYDLLASEARMAGIVALSKGEVPSAHWVHLGRPFGPSRRGPVLLSWAGTMFEYLMPALFLRMPPDSVLEEACRRAVRIQRDYGRAERVPWGVSESGYSVLSEQGHYQYRAFGVPQLGLRRVEGDRLVVAPYASLMAVSLAPGAVHRNLEVLRRSGGMGTWGPYEALDFGPRVTDRGHARVVRSYMSHHHGMILAALGGYLTGNRLVERVHRDPRIASVEPFLYERIPWRRGVGKRWVDRGRTVGVLPDGEGAASWNPLPGRMPSPTLHLAGEELVVEVGPDGRGGSRLGEWSIIRGGTRAGAVRGGLDLVLLDRGSGTSWRPVPEPDAPAGDDQEITFQPHRAEFIREAERIRTRMELFIPPGSNVEVRRIEIGNETAHPRHLRLALGAEIALAPWRDDIRHPAFQKLFVRAELLGNGEGILFERRPRVRGERPLVLLATLIADPGSGSRARWGTSRERFLGRGRNRARPAALDDPALLAPPTGAHHPLDPMACAVIDLDLDAWGSSGHTLLLAVGGDRDTVIRDASLLRSSESLEWARIEARGHAEAELRRLRAGPDEPRAWELLLAEVLHPNAGRRRSTWVAGSLSRVEVGQSMLWRWGVSGDIPFILLEGDLERESSVARSLLRAQQWWKTRGQEVDIVLIGSPEAGYHDAVRDRIRRILGDLDAESALGRMGGVHLIPAEGLRTEDRAALRALAAFRVDAGGAPLEGQVSSAGPMAVRRHVEVRSAPHETPDAPSPDGVSGSVDPESGDYVLELAAGAATPAPWVNVIAGEEVGFVVTESGGSFTWREDAGEFRLTPWSNDPVLGLIGEVLYLRDEETGSVWTPVPGPLGRPRTHRIRHGWGRTVIEGEGDGLEERVSWTLHPDLPAKMIRVRIRNVGARPRRISATYFADWVMGADAGATRAHVRVAVDAERGAVFARNPYFPRFAERVAFLVSDAPPAAVITRREAFLGARGPLDGVPTGLGDVVPGDRASPGGGAPCAVLQRIIELAPGQTEEVRFFLGAEDDGERAEEVVEALVGTGVSPAHAEAAGNPTTHVAEEGIVATHLEEAGIPSTHLEEAAVAVWDDLLGRVRVRTPAPRLDALVNGWLPYQTISSRLRGRTGFYQSGGAFGFRDQLQDVYTLLPLDPAWAIAHLQEAAARQFEEGDVLHWWHPRTTRGVRTRCSDDLLWLPWVLAATVRWTGDDTLLDREVPFLTGPPLAEGEDDRYDAFHPSEEQGSLLDHALRSVALTIDRLSPRGLPLIGTGDWNDGMDRVGVKGRGESVWLAWFFLDVCRQLIPLARMRGREPEARRMEDASQRVQEAVEAHAWDGDWYRRAFFDDGTPLGSRDSAEARIDSIAQSWAVLSGAGDPERAARAIESAWQMLVRPEDGIALLLTPPFTGKGADPGYIAAYPPGVRENGGQYTHAAIWLLRALARLGDGDRVGELLELILPGDGSEGGSGDAEIDRYRVEPYVLAADVYGAPPHVGRGGWTWYTGSAGWLWRVVMEDVLGISREGPILRVKPCIPSWWEGCEVTVRWGDGPTIEIRIRNPDRVTGGVRACTVNGRSADPLWVPIGGSDGRGGAGPGVMRVDVTLGGAGGSGR